MSMFVAALIFVVLLTVSIAHFLWAIGSRWPIRDEALLVRTVIGHPGITRIPRLQSLLVAIAVLAAGVFALALADYSSGGWWLNLIGIALAAVFLGRGVIGYTAAWRARFSLEPFATQDRKYYSPLCIGIGIAYIVLVIMRLI
ncbi:MAG: DUF3995 domain-containing protein [Devosia sp.]